MGVVCCPVVVVALCGVYSQIGTNEGASLLESVGCVVVREQVRLYKFFSVERQELSMAPNCLVAYVKKGLKHSHVFEIELCGERSWMLVREYQDGRCFVYSCSDSPKVATGLIKEKDPE